MNMTTVCSVCQQQLSDDESNKKNIFRDYLLIQSIFDKTGEIHDSQIKMKLHSAIELITDQKIFETGGSTPFLCNPCFEKLEGFMNFRSKLLSSFGIIFNEQSSFNASKQNSFKLKTGKVQDSKKDFDYPTGETMDCPKLHDRNLSSELINVDENSTSMDARSIQNDESIANDSTNYSRLQNDQDNNNLSVSDSSSENIDVQNCDDSPVKIQDYNIESEIDVCSGEDDEVLEIEGESRKDNITDEQSSSESEIEVCDYEPTRKKIRDGNSFSQPVPF